MRYLKPILASSWLACTLLAVLLLVGSLIDQPLLRRLELPIYDRLMPLRSSFSQPEVVLLSIDQPSRAQLGEDVSSRNQLARIITKLSQFGVDQLALLTPLSFKSEPNADRLLAEQLKRLRPLLAVEPLRSTALQSSLPDTALHPPAHPLPQPKQLILARQNPLAAWRSNQPAETGFLPPAQSFPALPLGHLLFDNDPDGRIRRHPLLIPSAGKLLPSLPLLLVLQQAHLDLAQLQLPPAGLPGTLHIGSHRIPIDTDYRLLLDLSGREFPYRHYSISQLLNGELDSNMLQNKLVLLENRAFAVERPLGARGTVTTGQLAALATATMLKVQPPGRPAWGWQLETLLLVYFLVLLLFLVPRLSPRAGLLTLSLFYATWLLAAGAALVFYGYWLQVVPAGLLCLGGYILVRRKVAHRDLRQEQLEQQRQLAINFLEQGRLEQALEKFLQFPPKDKASKEMLYNLGLDLERKRMPHKALTAYRHLLSCGRFRDARKRVWLLTEDDQQPVSTGKKEGTLVIKPSGEKPTLGRYRIERELGQGAMGTVYLGVDPKINRQVAIKTLAYDQVDSDQLPMVKERFFREAEAAGRLSHPKIVTIYDVGEENDLAYLAMELLEGQDLSYYCQPKRLLKPLQVVQILQQIAEALAYAHNQGVVHRDIKPANIIVLGNGQVKVTDFGIARMQSSSQTETGMILGTPSYMSPEQVAGKKVDGRSDLFSLGVVMYELLSGEKPFQGDSMTSLMYNIANGKYRPLGELCPRLPEECLAIVEKLLSKAVTRRFKSAELLAKELDTLQQRLEGR